MNNTFAQMSIYPRSNGGIIYTNTFNGTSWDGWRKGISDKDLAAMVKVIKLPDTGVFHITRQRVFELPHFYVVSVTIKPTDIPTTDTPCLTFPEYLYPCVVSFYCDGAEGVLYNNQEKMNYRLHAGAVTSASELVINGIFPKQKWDT